MTDNRRGSREAIPLTIENNEQKINRREYPQTALDTTASIADFWKLGGVARVTQGRR